MTNESIDALLKTGGAPGTKLGTTFPPTWCSCCLSGGEEDEVDDDQNMMDEEVDKSLHIKGQMNFMPDWNVVMFLCSPAIANLEQLQVRAKPYQSSWSSSRSPSWPSWSSSWWSWSWSTSGCRPLHLRPLNARLLPRSPLGLKVTLSWRFETVRCSGFRSLHFMCRGWLLTRRVDHFECVDSDRIR